MYSEEHWVQERTQDRLGVMIPIPPGLIHPFLPFLHPETPLPASFPFSPCVAWLYLLCLPAATPADAALAAWHRPATQHRLLPSHWKRAWWHICNTQGQCSSCWAGGSPLKDAVLIIVCPSGGTKQSTNQSLNLENMCRRIYCRRIF